MRGELNKETGEITAYIYKTVVADQEQVEDPLNQITLAEAMNWRPGVEVGSRFACTAIPARWAASPPSWPSRSSSRRSVKPSATPSSRNTPTREGSAERHREAHRRSGRDLDLGKAEARCPKREQSRLEQFSIGERVRVVLLKVDRAAKGPQVIVSRAAPELVSNLFQSEVPRSMTTPWLSAPLRAKPASAPRSPSKAATRTLTRWRLRGHERHARAVHYPGTARGKNRHHRVSPTRSLPLPRRRCSRLK